MKDYRTIIAENLTRLRTASHLTQAELADKLSYSDKAVSKWERGESIPDVTVLKTVADLYGVTVDYLLAEHSENEEIIIPERKMTMNQYRITWIAALGVLFLAAVIFLVSYICFRMVFYVPRSKTQLTDEVILPEDEIYKP